MSTKTRRCIAVVDDDPVVREVLGRLLRSAGYRVALFTSGNEFLAAVFKGRLPDCAILDFMMPGMSGLDVVTIMTVDRIRVPTIIVTGSADAELEAKFVNAGALTLLRKPVGENQLLAAIEKALAADDDEPCAVHRLSFARTELSH